MFGSSHSKIQNSFPFEDNTEDVPLSTEKKTHQGSLQNGQISQFYFKKLQEQEILLSLLILINIYLIIFSSSISFPVLREETVPTLEFGLYFTIICTAVAMVLVAMRTMTVLRLEKEQKFIYDKATLITSKKILNVLAEWIILVLQPYPFFIGSSFRTVNSFIGLELEYPINDFLAILSFGRIYILLRTALLMTSYMNSRANRLCKMYGCRADFSYSLKCMFKDHPLKLICLFYFISVAIFAYLIYLAERQTNVQSITPVHSSCNNYQNALWLVIITTTTVGYGDYYPQTAIGRFIVLFMAIWGTLIVSIMVVVVSNTLSMEKTEMRTSKILNKLELREKLEEKAGTVIGYLLMANSRLKANKYRQNIKKMLKAKNQFAEIRKSIREMAQVNDLQDQIAAHFLKLNGDIETLNKNQDKIIDYVHKYFNAHSQPNNTAPNQEPVHEPEHEQSDKQEQEERKDSPTLLQLFRTPAKQKMS